LSALKTLAGLEEEVGLPASERTYSTIANVQLVDTGTGEDRTHDMMGRSPEEGCCLKGKWFGHNKKDKPLYDFMIPALIVTQDGGQPDRGRYLKYAITAQAILKFLVRNRKLLKQDEDDNIVVEESKVEHPPLDFEKQLKSLIALKQDARITEFDDQFSSSELVYGITQDM
jgi:hypothetical protein